MAKNSVTTPIPPRSSPRFWPDPQRTLPQPPPNQPSVNKSLPILPRPPGGGGNPYG